MVYTVGVQNCVNLWQMGYSNLMFLVGVRDTDRKYSGHHFLWAMDA